MLIAVASRDGIKIDQHFGHAERFLIYEVEQENVRLVDEKKVSRYCSFDPKHPLRSHVLSEITDALKECRALAVAQIGEHPRAELEHLGIEPYSVTGPIKPILIELAKTL